MKKCIEASLAIFAAAALAVSCNNLSETTNITGNTPDSAFDEVNVIIAEMDIDTLVPVVKGKFMIDVPTDTKVLGIVAVGNYVAQFIPDGSKIKIEFGEPSKVRSSSKKSCQSVFNEMQEKSMSIQDEFRIHAGSISSDDTLTEQEKEDSLRANYEYYFGMYNDYNRRLAAENADNFVGLAALINIAPVLAEEELEEYIGNLAPELQENDEIIAMKNILEAKKATAEGTMFKDFTIEDSDGKTVSLSDYVGKGKYMLVDFWASWCGPCKAEIPNIKAVYDKYGGDKFDVLSVAVWDRSPKDSKDTAAFYGVNWNQIVNAGAIPTELYGIEGIPHIILFGPDGTILARDLREEGIEEAVVKYLNN